MEKFTYDPMTRADSQIRLLKVGRGSGKPVRCTISTFDTDACPEYEALSYTWELPVPAVESPQKIILNGRFLEIRENLYNFLERVAQESIIYDGKPLCPRYLWVDAVCINQKSDYEKSCQVRRMGQVYEQAQRVIVWLGQGSELTQTAMHLILDAAAANAGSWSVVNPLTEDHPFNKRYVQGFPALEALFNLSYWNRMWIIQEFLLAEDITIVYGNQSIDFDDMSMIHRAHFNAIDPADRNSSNALRSPPQSLDMFVISRRDLRTWMAEGHKYSSLQSVVEEFCHDGTFECADSRDRFYSLSALADDGDDIVVDDSKPASWLYWEVMAKWDHLSPYGAVRLIGLGLDMGVTGREENAILLDEVQDGWSQAVLGYSPVDIFADPETYIARIEKE